MRSKRRLMDGNACVRVHANQALLCPTAARRSFDLAAHPEHVGVRFKTLTNLLASIPGQNCDYSYPDLPLTTLVDAAPGAS